MTPPSPAHLALAVPNRPEAIDPARLRLLAFLQPAALSPKAIYALEVVLEEVLMNAAMHAHPDGGVHSVDLAAWVEPDDVVLRFEDDGIAFDPMQQPEEARPSTLDAARPGGLGLSLVRRLARHVAYGRRGGRNCLTVHIARP